jgi:hypothetical protein
LNWHLKDLQSRTLTVLLRLHIGCPSWIRTTIAGVRGQSPAVRRKGNKLVADVGSAPTPSAYETDDLPSLSYPL